MGAIEDRLGGLGLSLPAPAAAPPGVELPFASVRLHGGLAYVSGHGPLDGDRLLVTGSVGAEVTVEQALRGRPRALSMRRAPVRDARRGRGGRRDRLTALTA